MYRHSLFRIKLVKALGHIENAKTYTVSLNSHNREASCSFNLSITKGRLEFIYGAWEKPRRARGTERCEFENDVFAKNSRGQKVICSVHTAPFALKAFLIYRAEGL